MIEMNETESLFKCRNASCAAKSRRAKDVETKQNGDLITGSAPTGTQVT